MKPAPSAKGRFSTSGMPVRVLEAAALAGVLDVLASVLFTRGLAGNLPLEAAAGAVVHVLAALPVAVLVRRQGSRAWFGLLAVLAIPCLGVGLAAVSCATRGRADRRVLRRSQRRGLPWPVAEAWRRLERTPALGDALEGSDPEQRRAALISLSRREDPAAIALLRRAAWGPDPELALSAGIALDEVGARAERRARAPVMAEPRRAAR